MWTADELSTIGAADEVQPASFGQDGTLSEPVTIRVVRLGDDLYVRAFKRRASPWFRGTQSRRAGHIDAGGPQKDVEFVDPEPSPGGELDAKYRSKYRRYGPRYVDPIVALDARPATLKLVPRQ